MKIKITELDKLLESVSQRELENGINFSLGLVSYNLHKELTESVKKRYNTRRSLNSVLVKQSSVLEKRGKQFLTAGLEYKIINLSLAEFFSNRYKGNINSWATKPGFVHEVVVNRNQTRGKIVYGRKHYGGFMPKPASRFMFERQQKATWISKGIRAPFKPLYTIGLATMARIQFDNDPVIQGFKDKAVTIIAKNLKI